MPTKTIDPIDLLSNLITNNIGQIVAGLNILEKEQVQGGPPRYILNAHYAIALEKFARQYRDYWRACDRVAIAYRENWTSSKRKEAEDMRDHMHLRMMQMFGSIGDDPVLRRG